MAVMLRPKWMAKEGIVALAPCVRTAAHRSVANPCCWRRSLKCVMSLANTGGDEAQDSVEVAALPNHPSPVGEAPRVLQIHCLGPVLVAGAIPKRARRSPLCSSHSRVEGVVRRKSSPRNDAPIRSLYRPQSKRDTALTSVLRTMVSSHSTIRFGNA
eukprot:6477577-Amphidinium_carterae.1